MDKTILATYLKDGYHQYDWLEDDEVDNWLDMNKNDKKVTVIEVIRLNVTEEIYNCD